MLKNFLRVLAAVISAIIMGYFLTRKLRIWELEVPKPQPLSPPSSPAPKKKSGSSKRPAIKAKAGSINFERIGKASAREKDDLKKIKGIGPSIEKKLNAIGIYTYGQIANFTAEDEHMVGDTIAFFPGRIERDEWVKQAKALKQQVPK